MISMGIQEATAALIGNQVGALNIPIAHRYAKIILSWALFIGIIVSAVLLFCREGIASIFTSDEALLKLIVAVFPIFSCANIIDCLLLAVQGFVRALGI